MYLQQQGNNMLYLDIMFLMNVSKTNHFLLFSSETNVTWMSRSDKSLGHVLGVEPKYGMSVM